MNGRRKFLLGTVLSIQNTCFTYPACQICFSRLTQASNGYQCQKCNKTFQDAPQRYRLCMKVAEDQMLHIITVFGSCLERIFGSSASSLHRQLQESDESLCDGRQDNAQQLLFQAAEDCLIGRSFIFAVKVPDHLHRGESVVLPHLVACQVIPINNDPSVSILNQYHRLAEFILSNNSIYTRHEPSAQSTHKGFWDLADSESSHSLHHSKNQFADYWQQSLGLVSSPTLNTTTELLSCSHSQSEVSKVKEQYSEKEHIFQQSNLLAQSNVKPEELKVVIKDDLCIPKNSPLNSKNSSETVVKLQADTCGCNHSSSRANPLSSRVSCRHHRHLQNVCNSSSYGCQDCTACRKHFPSQNAQTAESHQVESRTWDEFLFSESLGEFIARLENSEEEKFQLQENKLCVRSNKVEDCEGPSKSVHDFWKTPAGLLVGSSHKNKNNVSTKTISPHSFQDPVTKMVESKGPLKIIQSSGFEDELGSSTSESLQELLPDALTKDSIANVDRSLYPTVSSCHKTFSPVNKNACSMVSESEGSFKISHLSPNIAKNLHKYIPSVEQYDFPHPKEAGDVGNERSEDEVLSLLRSEIVVSPEHYNASADLFDTGEELLRETLQSKHKRSLKRRQSMNVRSSKTPLLLGSPCTDIIIRRHSNVHAGFLQEVHETGVVHDLFSCLQSTPMLRPLSNSSFVSGNSCQVSISDPRAPVISRRSSNPLTNFLLKKIRQSLSRSQSNMFCTVSDNYRLYSPVSTSFSEMSRRQVLQRRRTLAIKSGKKKLTSEDKENCNVRKCNGRSNEEGGDGCAVTKHEMDGVEDEVTASPMISPLHTVTVLKPCDWSPELFNENSNMSKQNDTIQRRLF